MNERGRERRASGRARRRGLAKVVSQVEHSAAYQRSLGELHQLASAFQRGLDGSQRERWLAVEEAWLAHSERMQRAYYDAGFRRGVGWHSRASGQRAPGARAPASEAAATRVRAEAGIVITAGAECLAALACLVLELTGLPAFTRSSALERLKKPGRR